MLLPRAAAKFITKKALHVNINHEELRKCASLIAEHVKKGKLDMEAFKQNEVLPMNKGLTEDQLANYMFLIDALNFNFWTPKGQPKYTVSHNDITRTGYMAMVIAFNRAIDEGKPIYDPTFYSKWNLDDVKHIFRSDTESEMPLIKRRVEVAQEVGSILLKKFEGNFVNVLKKAENSAVKLVDLVTSEFPCFYDVHSFEDEQVCIFKRAQILTADLNMLYMEKSLGDFKDIDDLTMFADYRVPQALVYFKVMKYSDELSRKLENEHLFTTGDREEVEIRGVSLEVGEQLVEETNKILKAENYSGSLVNSIKVDYFLWDYRYNNSDALESTPYHKCRCHFY